MLALIILADSTYIFVSSNFMRTEELLFSYHERSAENIVEREREREIQSLR